MMLPSGRRINIVQTIQKDETYKCPECGCERYIHKNLLGEGYRVCCTCGQEWWTDINYANNSNATNRRLPHNLP